MLNGRSFLPIEVFWWWNPSYSRRVDVWFEQGSLMIRLLKIEVTVSLKRGRKREEGTEYVGYQIRGRPE